MRLLDVNTYELVDFTLRRPIPEYGILSHTWGEEEVSFADVASPNRYTLKGWTKVENTCRLARDDGYAYVWIDTCCIDKSSSAELSEAINSMFAWYQQSAKCYVALSDVHDSGAEHVLASRWWTRGWTLQELLAPQNLFFYNSTWKLMGQKKDYVEDIYALTGIPIAVLEGERGLKHVCIAARMSWASERDTTRLEDEAYCLMGIFGVSMPLIYGEGRRAFQRLQYEIIRTTTDLSFLAHESADGCELLAKSTWSFRKCRNFDFRESSSARSRRPEYNEMALTNQGLKLPSVIFWPIACGSSQVGRHYSIIVARQQSRSHAEVSVCFRRISSRVFVRHPHCQGVHVAAPDPFRHYFMRHIGENVTLLFEANEDSTSYWPRRPLIRLPAADSLRIVEPLIYPSSPCNWEARTIGLPYGTGPNSFIAIMDSTKLFSRQPILVIHSSSASLSLPSGYFLREVMPSSIKDHQFGLLQHLSSDGLSPSLQRKLKKKRRRSMRYVESDSTTTFVVIAFSPESSFTYDNWQMRLQQISRREHYLMKMKDFWLRALPHSAKRLEN